MAAIYETLAQRFFPARRWLIAAFVVLPFVWAVGVRYLLTKPGFISPETDWRLLKGTVLFAAWPWGLFLLAVCFHPARGLLRVRAESPGLGLNALRVLMLACLALVFVSPFVAFVLAP